MREIMTLCEVEGSEVPVLFIVHPGSACGSADFNLGVETASGDRENLTSFIEQWAGGVIVLRGEHDGELTLRRYRPLGQAVAGALQAARATGISVSVAASDPTQMTVARTVVKKLGLALDRTIVVTGCWASHAGNSGCVNSVFDVLREIGFTNVSLSGSAIFEDE